MIAMKFLTANAPNSRSAESVSQRYGNAVDLTVHIPPAGGDPRKPTELTVARKRCDCLVDFVGIEFHNDLEAAHPCDH